ncbi:MAG: hypothetical protein M3O85_04905 [Acidobacteriota bacterium]|nr:hypothetical protein [Acidobacteriota bacterium]
MKCSSFFSSPARTARYLAFCVLLSLDLVAWQTWLFKADPLWIQVEFAIKLLTPIVLLSVFRCYVPPPKARILLALYALLILYVLALAPFSEDPALVLINTCKFLYAISILFVLFLIVRPAEFSLKFLYVPVFLGVLFSLQAVTVFTLVHTGHQPEGHIVTLVGYKNMKFLSYGILGYAASLMGGEGSVMVYRAQSFFGEPTRLASFLEVSAILAMGFYIVRRERKMLVAALLCATAWLLAFSMTGYVVGFLVVVFYFWTTSWRKWKYLAPALTAVIGALVVVAVLTYLKAAVALYAQPGLVAFAFGHPGSEVTYRVGFVRESIRLFLDYPFGIGVIGVENSRILEKYPGAGGLIAPMVWVVIGGIVGLTLQLAIVLFAIFKVVFRQVQRKGRMERYIALAFVAQVLHHCVAGDWFDPLFFVMLASLILTDSYAFSFAATPKACT